LQIKIVKKISEIPPQDWKKVFPDILESYEFFNTIDESNFPQFSFFYILIYDNDLSIGATSCFLMDFPLDVAAEGLIKKFTKIIRFICPRLLTPRALICGLPWGEGRIGMADDSGEIIQAIYSGMEDLAKKERASIIAFKDFRSTYSKALKGLLSEGFTMLESLPNTDMDISFTSFEEYLRLLSGVARSGLRRKFKEVDGKVKISLEIRNKLEGKILDEAYALYLQTYDKQEMKLEKITIDFFANAGKNMPDQSRFFLWRIEGKMAAFAFCLVKDGYFIHYYLGFDYALAYRYHLYFVHFRDLLTWCIENNIKKYEMGTTSYEPKRRLGFNFIPLYIYAKHRNKFYNPLFKIICQLFKPVDSYAGVRN
jgi:predicted N-acyltransferase